MSETLYRKYRPALFGEMVAQEHVRTTLLNQLKADRVGHAYLFTGPRGVGKTTSARLLAKAVNCLDLKDGEPCNACASCEQIGLGQSIDIVEIDAASHTGVDNVRENIIESVRFAPAQRKKKVYIIDEVHMLSTSAFNALLKTLEEPPAHALFILATTEIHKVPQTIISRTQRFDFRRIPVADLVGRLRGMAKSEGVEIADKVLSEVARHADGGQRDAESLLAQILAIGGKKIGIEEASLVLPQSTAQSLIELIAALGKRDAAAGIVLVNRLLDEGIDLRHFLEDLTSFIRELMLAKVGNEDLAFTHLGPEEKKNALGALDGFTVDNLAHLSELLIEARNTRASITQLPLELAIVRFCNPAPVSEPATAQPDLKVEEQFVEVAPVPQATVPEVVIPEKAVIAPENSELEPATLKEALQDGPVEVVLPQVKTDGSVSFMSVKGKWNEVAERVAHAHTSLSFLLREAELIGMDDEHLRLGFQYKFHADTMNADKNRRMVEDVVGKVMGSPVRVRGEYMHASGDTVVGDLIGELGGKEV